MQGKGDIGDKILDTTHNKNLNQSYMHKFCRTKSHEVK